MRATVAAVIAVASTLPAADPPPDVRPLVAKLASADFRDREAAGQALTRHGDRALPGLKAALNATTDAEVARRLEVLIERLDRTRLTTARLVTLSVKNAKPEAVLAEIGKQTGYAVRYDGPPVRARVTLDWAGVPFWRAVDDLAGKVGAVVNGPTDDGSVSLDLSPDTLNPHVAYCGPFKLIATSIGAGRNLNLSGLSRTVANVKQPEYLNLQIQIVAEPKAAMLGLGQPVVLAATDDKDNSLLPADPTQQAASYPGTNQYKAYALSYYVPMLRADRSGEAIKAVRSKIGVAVLAETRTDVVVALSAAKKGAKFAGRGSEIEVHSAEVAKTTVAVEMTVRRRTGHPDDFSWVNALQQRFEVTDDQGQRWQTTNVDTTNYAPNSCTLKAVFAPAEPAKAGRPARLALTEWVPVVQEVEFELKDVPLP